MTITQFLTRLRGAPEFIWRLRDGCIRDCADDRCPIEALADSGGVYDGRRKLQLSELDTDKIVNASDFPNQPWRKSLLKACKLPPEPSPSE